LFRTNLALYADYGTDFAAGEREARKAVELKSSVGLLPLAFAQLGLGQRDLARETYRTFATASSIGRSLAPSGLGDLAAVEGRFSEAEKILEEGADVDLKANENDRAAAKLVALANIRLLLHQNAAAVTAAENALALSQAAKIRFLVARIFIETANAAKA